MGPGAGYVIRIPGEPSVYLTGDTVLTEAVRDTLREQVPDICIVPGAGARLDIGGPVLMTVAELKEFVRLAPGRVVINHIDALNHCPTTRDDIVEALGTDLISSISLPLDGESIPELS